VQYLGADRWVLYGIADCELHAFVDADPRRNVQRLYWVQFEGYLPTKPELKHTYDSLRHLDMGGMDFYVDTWVRSRDADVRPGSDVEHIGALIHAKAYHMPAAMMYVRLRRRHRDYRPYCLRSPGRQRTRPMANYREGVSRKGATEDHA
jgi:hypothetical protein